MISAAEAQSLFCQPLFTLEEIEQQIREKAASQTFTCFDKARLTPELIATLIEAGYEVTPAAHTFVVRWK